jgi:hypothetical protein
MFRAHRVLATGVFRNASGRGRLTRSLTAAAAMLTGLLLGSAADAAAQDWRLAVTPRAGMAVPSGNLAKLLDPGPAFGLAVAYPVHRRIALKVDANANLLPGVTVSTGRTAADVTVMNYHFGAETALLMPESIPLSLLFDLGVGAVVFRGDEFEFTPTARRTHRQGHASARSGLALAYSVRPAVTVMADAQLVAAHARRDHTLWFSNQDPEVVRPFTSIVIIPVSFGVRARI